MKIDHLASSALKVTASNHLNIEDDDKIPDKNIANLIENINDKKEKEDNQATSNGK